MLFKDQTNFTSEPINFRDQGMKDIFVGVTGPGPVALELQCDDGVWRSYPETRFSAEAARIVSLPMGLWRVVISGGPTTVQVSM